MTETGYTPTTPATRRIALMGGAQGNRVNKGRDNGLNC